MPSKWVVIDLPSGHTNYFYLKLQFYLLFPFLIQGTGVLFKFWFSPEILSSQPVLRVCHAYQPDPNKPFLYNMACIEEAKVYGSLKWPQTLGPPLFHCLLPVWKILNSKVLRPYTVQWAAAAALCSVVKKSERRLFSASTTCTTTVLLGWFFWNSAKVFLCGDG